MDCSSIRKYLRDPENTPVLVLPSADSTNTCLKRLAEQGAPNHQVVIAEKQTAGRGRLGRRFYSPGETGLYLSILFYDRDNPALNRYLTMAAAAAVFDAIRAVFNIRTALKWVNDIYLDNKKIAGILAEHICRRSSDDGYTVLGIGINLFEPADGFPEEIADIAGALFKNKTDCPAESIPRFAAVLIDRLRDVGASVSPDAYIETYRRQSWVIGQKVRLIRGSETVAGIVKDFNQWGHLILKKDNGEEETFFGGEISLRKE